LRNLRTILLTILLTWPRGLPRLTGSARLLRVARLLLRVLPVGRPRLLRAWLVTLPAIRCALLRLIGTVLSGRAVRPLLAGLVAAIVVQARIGAAERALLGDDPSADALRGVHLAHETLIAQRLSRRDRKRHRGKAGAATYAGADREAART
jgi:hypothetical protein